ncbi:hypothetical protein Pmar_PMAR017228 [Perkinsus marinus ATCC 50983]|uniref:Uncharacterized protein n=1 Tax=Perkinsus marinus (strain ATCC 50983 / TXsc) TaxID=423536 RepID=C5KNB2_PERM5|nr:hypothetical protein Pmar_PMAR017228 [Perkinsus marinus ATCC 50983]EER14026.1 hypothetical protein Pmar_PMAR017228 [Perkinsus marinus ATCC 50983]|eukprot:XP_002782231.1 hypothetical protein Pmar_PMAR017228 [Perkinsus marinus ATCC 50983]
MKLDDKDKEFIDRIYREEYGDNADPIATFRDKYIASQEPIRVEKDRVLLPRDREASRQSNCSSMKSSVVRTLLSKEIRRSDRLMTLQRKHAKFIASTSIGQQ